MVLNNCLRRQKRRSWVLIGHLHGQKIRLCHRRCIDHAPERIGPQLFRHGLPQDGAVDDLRKRGGQAGGCRKVLVNRRRALLHGDYKGRSSGIPGHIGQLCCRIRAHTHNQRRSHNQIPPAQHVPQKNNRVIGKQRNWRFPLLIFILRHASILHNHNQPRLTGIVFISNGIVHPIGTGGISVHMGVHINEHICVIPP